MVGSRRGKHPGPTLTLASCKHTEQILNIYSCTHPLHTQHTEHTPTYIHTDLHRDTHSGNEGLLHAEGSSPPRYIPSPVHGFKISSQLERQLHDSEHVLLLQRTWVLFLGPNRTHCCLYLQLQEVWCHLPASKGTYTQTHIHINKNILKNKSGIHKINV